ncbi:MAG: hypothetical protein EOM59_13230 [Clostridia bacterium]|nr:hypothetical protein [Acholeplasmataceae bacterium]NCB43562.1 hypothetical protein [Clostridia bacterium]
MKNETNFKIFHQAFSSRIKVSAALSETLNPSLNNLKLLKEACLELGTIISVMGQGDIEDQYRAYHTAIDIFVSLAEWKHAIRNAEPDAQRFLSSAKLKASELDRSLSFASNKRLEAFLNQIDILENVYELAVIQDNLKQWTLPLLLFANIHTKGPLVSASNRSSEKTEKLETTVAFLRFDIDGEPAKKWNYLKPRTYYDLTIKVRVSNWPPKANLLLLIPVTVGLPEKDWLPSFKFEKPEGDGPFILTGTGRAVLEIAHSFGSRPYEFLYAAEFDNSDNCGDVAVVGHRHLLLEGCDVASNPLTGFSNVDRHLLHVRDKLRTFPGLHSDDVANTMIVLGGLGNIAAQALKGGLFEAGMSESAFQHEATKMLRTRIDIGENLESHLEAAGGFTDLTFRDIPIELKIENSKVLSPKDCTKFFNQTAAYAIGLGKRIGVLSVLEASPKSAPVGIIEDDIEVFAHQIDKSLIVIVVVIVRGGFPKPSSYSR